MAKYYMGDSGLNDKKVGIEFWIQKVRKQRIRFWDERTFWHEIIYKSLIPTFGKPM